MLSEAALPAFPMSPFPFRITSLPKSQTQGKANTLSTLRDNLEL